MIKHYSLDDLRKLFDDYLGNKYGIIEIESSTYHPAAIIISFGDYEDLFDVWRQRNYVYVEQQGWKEITI